MIKNIKIMGNNKYIKISFWLSILAIILSLSTILIWFVSVNELTCPNLDSFIGTIVTLLAIIVTFVIGWQIYNAVEIKEKIKIVDSLRLLQEQQEHKTNQMIYNAWHHLSYTSAQMSANDHDYVNAYRLLLNSLSNSIFAFIFFYRAKKQSSTRF